MKERTVFEGVRIIGIADRGKAVGRDGNGRVVFVNDAVPGDIVDVEITRKRQNCWHGKALRFKSYSDERTNPVCEHFDDCGGCKWQNLQYSAQLRHKETIIRDAFERISKIKGVDQKPIIGADHSYYYRNKLEFTFSNRRWVTREEISTGKTIERSIAAGFHPTGFFNKVVDIENCHLQAGDSNEIRNFIRDFCIKNKLAFYDVIEHKGWLRNVIVRNTTLGEQMVIISFGYDNESQRNGLMESIVETFPSINSLFYVINDSKNADLSRQIFKLSYGSGFINEEIGNIRYKIGPMSFFQTNSYQTLKLFGVIKEFASLTGDEIVWDLYSGIGAISLFIAADCKEVIGFEEVSEAIGLSWENATINGIQNVTFLQGDVRDTLRSAKAATLDKPKLIITDPPRTGMHIEVSDAIRKIKPHKIIYVSCNPSTQARDIGYLKDDFDLVRLQPVDMFPHTSHVENVALLEQKKNEESAS